ncbi:oxidoreductase [Aliidongia dinghuensis]|uniref:Oxidoreductase n=1 Tax=Aliidongia dinghuensis TaxID=1867774 RepID=A0A8J2YPW1_9PROT|nr:aldo/keto reductase [Aliidongia dinghuensis]GGF01880.1 oxidoreductase [Aliidongia dinghuensis]
MQQRFLGTNGPRVSAIGLGCMGMSGVYGAADDQESVATIRAALDAGINLLNTGDFYGMGHNESLVREAIRGRRDQAFVAVKFGALRGPDGSFVGFDARPAALKTFLTYTLQRLGTDHVDLYQPARIDPAVPVEETVGAIADMVKAGYVRHIGLSEASAATIRRAHKIHPIAALEIEYSLIDREIEAEVLPTLRELGVSLVAYGVLSRGLLGGDVKPGQTFEAGDFRGHAPRFAGENLAKNHAIVEALAAFAAARGTTPAQVAIAWALSRGPDVVPLVGTKRRSRLAEAIAATDLTLTAADLAELESIVRPDQVAGTRYAAAHMALLNG